MNFNGFTWLLIIVGIFITLYFFAKIKKTEVKQEVPMTKKEPKKTGGRSLHKTARNLQDKIPEYNFSIRKNHITVKKEEKKLAMITLDKKTAIGNRKLGEVMVLNFHREPDHTEILKHLDKAA